MLNDRSKEELARYIAANGENYEAYVRYAENRGWFVYTKGYLHRWCNKHRDLIRAWRGKQEDEIREATTLSKLARVEKLEHMLARLEEKMVEVDDADTLIKLVEQQRKLLQSISQERGEWNKPEQAADEKPSVMALIEAIASKAPQLPQPSVDGEYREVE